MTDLVQSLREKIEELQAELEREISTRREALNYHFQKSRVVFEEEILARHRALRMGLGRFFKSTRPVVILTAPVIYSLIVPIALADLCATIYQHICFRAYRIPRVRRSDYIVFDRGLLAYLNIIEKLNCIYCEYANGVIAYVREIASRTEQYWCPIKHARAVKDSHARTAEFLDYGDGEDYHQKLEKQRQKCRACGKAEKGAETNKG